MLLTITTTHVPATDLGFLLHKHPERVQQFALPFGVAHVFYPEASTARCTAALFVEVDPIGLVRGRGEGGGALDAYVNDRPYAASSFLSVAIGSVYRSALIGATETHVALADTPIPLAATLPAVPCAGGEAAVRTLFAPLGYTVTATPHVLDPAFPEWGQSRLLTVTLAGSVRLRDLLSHLYVLIPVLDGDKHYYVGTDEVEKLVRRGGGWLAAHPARDLITARYLRHRRALTADALARLAAEDDAPDPDATEDRSDAAEAATEETATVNTGGETPSLHQQRIAAVLAALREAGAARVLDLGCGEGKLLRELMADRQFTEIVGLDASTRALARAAERLRLDCMAPAARARVEYNARPDAPRGPLPPRRPPLRVDPRRMRRLGEGRRRAPRLHRAPRPDRPRRPGPRRPFPDGNLHPRDVVRRSRTAKAPRRQEKKDATTEAQRSQRMRRNVRFVSFVSLWLYLSISWRLGILAVRFPITPCPSRARRYRCSHRGWRRCGRSPRA